MPHPAGEGGVMRKLAGSEEPLGQDWSSLIQKQISRRGFLQGGLLAGLGIPMASTVLTPHGRSLSRIKSSSGGKTITVASYANAETLDPMLSLDGQSPLLWRASYERLLNYRGNTANYEPFLASAYEISPDKLTYTFHLRP